ncbi:MAG: S41 family peptidase [Phycisphaerae bacterium]
MNWFPDRLARGIRTNGMARGVLVAACTMLVMTSVEQPARADDVVFARHLSLSPDGSQFCFGWAGDVWKVSIDGGAAQRMSGHPAEDSHPIWSPDGKMIAFASDRNGSDDIYLMDANGNSVRRLTFSDRGETPTSWTPDSKQIYFNTTIDGNISWDPQIFRVSVEGGQPVQAIGGLGSDAVVSPDGKSVAFTRGASKWWRKDYRGSANHDIWLCELGDETYHRVTKFDGTDRLPQWSSEGDGLYFLSDRSSANEDDRLRTGSPQRLNEDDRLRTSPPQRLNEDDRLRTSPPQRLNEDDRLRTSPPQRLNVWYQPPGEEAVQITDMKDDDVRDLAVSQDGKTIVFTHWDKIYRISTDGADRLRTGPPQTIKVTAGGDSPFASLDYETLTRDADEAAVSPDGKEVALVVRGEIYVIQTEEDKLTRRVTNSPSRDWQVVWSPDGKALYFVSDRDGKEEIYRAMSSEEPTKPLADSLRFNIEKVTEAKDMHTLPQISPDGKKLAYLSARGDLVVRELKSGDEKTIVESWNAPSYAWSPDSKKIAYAREDDEFNADIWIIDSAGKEKAVNISQHPDNDMNPQWSADGNILAFASARIGMDADVYMVFLSRELDEMSSVEINEYFDKAEKDAEKRKPLKSCDASGKIKLAGGKESKETKPADSDKKSDDDAEKKKVEENDSDDEDMSEANLRKMFKAWLDGKMSEDDEKKKDDKKKAKKYEHDLKNAYMRIRRVTSLPGDQTNYAMAPSGQWFMFTSSHDGEGALYRVRWDGDKQEKAAGGRYGALQWQFDGKRMHYLKGGVPGSVASSGKDAKTHGFRAKMAIDFVAEAKQKFDDAARTMGLRYYHPTLRDLDWTKLTEKYRALALRTRSDSDFNEVFNMLLGELNGSHLGIRGGRRPGRDNEDTGYLGVRFDPDFDGPGLRVAYVVPESPADRAESKLHAGDVILAIGGVDVGPQQSAEELLIETVNDPVILKVKVAPKNSKKADAAKAESSEAKEGDREDEPDPFEKAQNDDADSENAENGKATKKEVSDDATKDIVIRPISYGAFRELTYEDWVRQNREYVEKQSDGRVGYLHIRGMGEPEFYRFERDLYAAANGKDGLIIDVRYNGGGWTADWVMQVLSVKRHSYTIPRGGGEGYPQSRLVFYAWTKPATMMCNQYSYSNAEIVSHAFKNLGRGPLVGMPTFGAVISTGSYGLIDGGAIRMPFRGWYTLPDRVDMELNGAMPDVVVELSPADEANDRHPQLDAAIKATLEQFKK